MYKFCKKLKYVFLLRVEQSKMTIQETNRKQNFLDERVELVSLAAW